MTTTPHIVMVGHCMPDQFMLKRTIKKSVPDAQISKANSSKALDEVLATAELLLINRVLDGRFDDTDSIAMITRLAPSVPCILISNYEDAQLEAQQAGARPGFGKSKLGSDETYAKIQSALGIATT